jgi:ubiquinone/menaquinone biosynthesis C-methylase UbiE
MRPAALRLEVPDLFGRAKELAWDRGTRRILDLGSGSGEFLALFRAEGWKIAGLDLDPGRLQRARQRLPGAALLRGDLERLPLASDRQDLVTLLRVLHYLSHPDRALSEAARILRPGGWLILADRTTSPDPSLCEIHHRIERLRHPSFHRLWTSAKLSEGLQAAGFAIRLIDSLEESVPLETWLAGVDGEGVRRIQRELAEIPTPDLGGISFEVPGAVRVRIDLFLAQKR